MTATGPPGFQRSLYFIFRDPSGHALLSHPPHISRYFAVGHTAKRSGPIRIISGVCAPTPRPTDSAGPSQGESGQKDTEDAASTMSHDITVSSQPRTRNGEQSPFRGHRPHLVRILVHRASSHRGSISPFSPYASPRESVAHRRDSGRPVLRGEDAAGQGHELRAPGAPVPSHGSALRRALRRGVDVVRLAGTRYAPGPRYRPGGPRARDRRAVRRPVQVL